MQKLRLVASDVFYETIGIPKFYRNKFFQDLTGREKEIEKIKQAISEEKSIFLTGKTGTGKTHLAIASLIEYCIVNKPDSWKKYPRFLSSVELFLNLKQTFNGDGSEKEILDAYSRIPLLCIDDVGAEKISDWTRQIFYALVDRRYRDIKQTIITSNLSLDKISELIDDRIASRIVEMGIVIELQGEDWRLK